MGPLSRRELLKVASLAAGSALALPVRARRPAATDPQLPQASLGKTGRILPRLGLGCFPVGQLPDEDAAAEVLTRALDMGVRYLDTAPSYGDGRSERRVGAALMAWLAAHPDRSRADFFVATKTLERSASGARRELDASLERLGLDYVDSVQCHEVHDDFETLFAEDGVLAALRRARDEGLIRHIGITCHRNPRYAIESIRRFPPAEDGSGFVTALVPVNPIDVQHLSFVRGFLPFAVEQGVAVVAMKIFGGGFLLNRRPEDGTPAYTPADLLRYALAQPGVALAVPGCDQVSHVETDHAAVLGFAQPEPAWLAEIEARAGTHEGKTTEWYKEELAGDG